MFQRLALLLSGILALTCWAPQARAEEDGLKVGAGRLHPYFELEGDYNTAAQVAVDPETKTSSGIGDFILHFRPGLKLDIPSSTLAVSLSGAAEYLVYTGLNSSNASSLNRLQAQASLDLGFLRGSVVSFDLGDHFSRSDQTTDVGLPFGALSFYNDAHAAITLAPGGGSLTITPGYHLVLETFSALGDVSGATDDLGNLNYLQHRITLDNSWRFLPKTAILLNGEYNIRDYSDSDANTDISFFRASVGLSGLVTPHFSTLLQLGWSTDVTSHTFNSIIGQLEGTYIVNETSNVRLGVLRTFQPIPSAGSDQGYVSFEDDRGYLEGKLTVMDRLTLHGSTAVVYLGFRGTNPRNDLLYTLSVGADFEITRWFIASAGDSLFVRSSDLKKSTAFAGLNLTSDQVYVKLRVTY